MRVAPPPINLHLRRLRRFAARQGGLRHFHAIYDLGTRAARLVVGPRDPGRMTDPALLFSASVETELGLARDTATGTLQPGERLRLVIGFVRAFRGELVRQGLSPSSIRALGTAPFRGIGNREAILSQFQQATGLTLEVLPEQAEARLSWLSAAFQFRGAGFLAPGDEIVLVDQGGGSTEIAHAPFHSNRWPAAADIRAVSLPLGAVGIQKESDRLRIDPQLPLTEIVDGLTGGVSKALSEFSAGIPGTRRHLFGMGSALTRMREGNPRHAHGQWISRVELAARLQALRARVTEGGLAELDDTPKRSQFYGIPLLLSITDALGAEGLRICSFGLRYGALYETALGLELSK